MVAMVSAGTAGFLRLGQGFMGPMYIAVIGWMPVEKSGQETTPRLVLGCCFGPP